MFLKYFGVLVDEKKEGIDAQVLSSFLSSSLNIELVYIILTGITSFSSAQLKVKEEELFINISRQALLT